VAPKPPSPGRWDVAAAVAVVALLVVAYGLFPSPPVQYGAWLAIFSIWMLWFVAYGVRWLYDEEG